MAALRRGRARRGAWLSAVRRVLTLGAKFPRVRPASRYRRALQAGSLLGSLRRDTAWTRDVTPDGRPDIAARQGPVAGSPDERPETFNPKVPGSRPGRLTSSEGAPAAPPSRWGVAAGRMS